MKIVVDTNVMISGIFFGGFPQKVLRAIVSNEITACATTKIIDEYEEIVERMIQKKQGHLNANILTPVLQNLETD